MSTEDQNRHSTLQFPSFAGLKAFFVAASEGGVTRASRRLGVSASAISHQLRNLENELGVRLTVHRKGSFELTPEGINYFRAIEGAMGRIADATTEIRSAPGRRRVSLTLTPSFAAGWLMPRMRDLAAKYPDLELNLITTTRVVDLVRENVDLAIRRSRKPWTDHESRILAEEHIVPVVAPEVVTNSKSKDLAGLLASNRILVNTTLLNEWDGWCQAHDFEAPPASQRFNLETYELTIQAARDGLGIALGRRPIVDGLLEEGSLVLASPDVVTDILRYFVVWPNEFELSSSARRVRDWLLSFDNEKYSIAAAT